MAKTSKRSARQTGWRRHLTTDRIIIGGALTLTVVFIAIVIVQGITNAPPTLNLSDIADKSVAFAIQGQDHIDDGAQHPAYNSNPPTSGWHYRADSPLGVFTTPVVDETMVHNLEHGHIWLSYRDADDQEALNILREVQRAYPQHVIITYRPQNDTRVAAAAWGRLLTEEEPNKEELLAFALRYRARAPENIPG